MSFSANKAMESDNVAQENVNATKQSLHNEETENENDANYLWYEYQQQEKALISARSTSPPEPSSFTLPEHTDQDQEQHATQSNTIPAWPKPVSCNDIYMYSNDSSNKSSQLKLNTQEKELQQTGQLEEQRENEEEEKQSSSESVKEEVDNAASKEKNLQHEEEEELKIKINDAQQREEMRDVNQPKCYDNNKSKDSKLNKKATLRNYMSNKEANKFLPLEPTVDLQIVTAKIKQCALPPIANSANNLSNGLTNVNKTIMEVRPRNAIRESSKPKNIVPLSPHCFDNTRFVSITPSPCTQGLTSSTPCQSTNYDNDNFMAPSYNSSTATDMQSPNGWHTIDSMNSNATVKNYNNITNNHVSIGDKKIKSVVNKSDNFNKGNDDNKCNNDRQLREENHCSDALNSYYELTENSTENKGEMEERKEYSVQEQKLISSLDITLSAESLPKICTDVSVTHSSDANDVISAVSDHRNSNTEVIITTASAAVATVASTAVCNKHNTKWENFSLAKEHEQREELPKEEHKERNSHVCFHTCHKHATQATNFAAEAEIIATAIANNKHNFEVATTAAKHSNFNDSVSVQPMVYELCNKCKSLSRLERSVEHASNGRRSRKNASSASLNAVFSMLKVCQ